ncbi:MAG: histidinol-phosphate transaminase [Euryarchaeota archaeon]|nr:histidinol-phosphate transaminase [Euryarchaeota archaeon]
MLRQVLDYLPPYRAPYAEPCTGLLRLDHNENPEPVPDFIREALGEAAGEVSRYPDPRHTRLKESLSGYTGLGAEHISVGSGASEILDTLCKISLEPLDRVVTPSPAYGMYSFLAMVHGASPDFVKTRWPRFEAKPRDILRAAEGARVIFLCSPNNPTGQAMPRGDIERVAEEFPGLVVVDEAYIEFGGKTVAPRVGDLENLVVVRSLSKFLGLAGLRVGYALASPRVAEALEKVRLPFNVSGPAQHVARVALEHLDHYRGARERIVRERERLRRALGAIPVLKAAPSEANFLLVRQRGKRPLYEELERAGIVVREMSGVVGLEGGRYLRITVGTPEENDRLIAALRRLFHNRNNNRKKKETGFTPP